MMNFDVETSRPSPNSVGKLMEFLSDRKTHLHLWRNNPPHSLGWIVLLLVSLELVLARRLFHDLGGSPEVIGNFISTVIIVVFIELIFAFMAHKMANLFDLDGRFSTLLTFLNLNLTPLLLFLPITLMIWVSGGSHAIRLLLFLLLSLKIFSDWKMAADINYNFKKWQSAVFVATIGFLIYLVIPILLLLGFTSSLSDLLTLLN